MSATEQHAPDTSQTLTTKLVQWSLGAIARLPLHRQQQLGSTLGAILRLSGSRLARVTEENIALCWPELSRHEQQQLAKQSLCETGKTIIESAWAWYGDEQACLDSIVAVKGEAPVIAARNNASGIIFLLPHLGNWEVANHYLGKHYQLTHMYQPNKSRTFETVVQTGRSRTGTQFVAANATGVRAQLKTLIRGGAIGSMPDQEPDVHQGKFADFFSQRALTSDLLLMLQKKSGAQVFTCYCKRLADGNGFELVFQETDIAAQTAKVTATNTTDNQEIRTRMNRAIEHVVRQSPAQYLWSYKRFRTRPDGEPPYYQFNHRTIFTRAEQSLIRLGLEVARHLPAAAHRPLSIGLYHSMRIVNTRQVRVARTNLAMTKPHKANVTTLLQRSLQHLADNALSLGNHWFDSDNQFNASINTVQGRECLEKVKGVVVLTPPLGYREVVMRYLGSEFHTTEYYHPARRTALDHLIRQARASMGITLVPHSTSGLSQLNQRLDRGEVITLCPDQQPRLRGGEFVPFFGMPALTTRVMQALAARSDVTFLLAVALNRQDKFDIHFDVIRLDKDMPVLVQINQHLQTTVLNHEDQYRWSDKRFNIQPPGAPRLYR